MALSSKGGGGGGGGGGRLGVCGEQQGRGVMVQGLRKWPKKDNGRGECSPERNKVWTEPPPKLKANFPATSSFIMSSAESSSKRVVPVVYYLSRNGQLEHPHFIQVPLSSSTADGGLFLRDVINRLNVLRGKGMASQYSWSSKRSYKNGYVWHDLEENDLIHPVHGHEYVLKGSEILQQPSSSSSNYDSRILIPSSAAAAAAAASSSSNSAEKPYHPMQLINTTEDSDFPIIVGDGASGTHRHDNYYNFNRRRNQSWSSTEYKVYKTDLSLSHEFSSKLAPASDAATQTDDKRRRRRPVVKAEEVEGDGSPKISPPPSAVPEEQQQQQSTELRREEISPPPSDSSPETLESLMKADGRLILATTTSSHIQHQPAADAESCQNPANERVKASSVLMSLFSCGSISFRDCGAAAVKDHGFSLVSSSSSHYKPRLPRGGNGTASGKESRISTNGVEEDCMMGGGGSGCSSFRKMVFEERECFSGSLLVDDLRKKDEFVPLPSTSSSYSSATLKRSSSYNADRSSHLKLEEKEFDGVRAKCLPRKPKTRQQQPKPPPPPPNMKKELTNSPTTNGSQDNSTTDHVTDAR